MMDVTPPDDSKQSPIAISSTPLTHITRKRKHEDTLEFIDAPKFSSTLNESFIKDISDIRIVNSVHNTPEKRNFMTNAVVSSPIQESRKILYSSIKVVKPERKFGVVRSNVVPKNYLLNRILNINVIMDVIFKNLSGGDLYRFGLVSSSFYRALEKNIDAFARYRVYKGMYKLNKENYVITPPGSPEKADSPPRTSSERFNKFIRFAKCLNSSQSLTKCLRCGDAAVVDNDISQCQNMSCGLIYCLRCSSSSETGAKDFVDACGHASLRPKLGNMSNRMENSFFNFSSQDSGFYSENESPPKVKRNLFSTSSANLKALSVSNKNKSQMVTTYPRRKISYVPVVLNETQTRKPLDCDSPPRYEYAVGSKQSKKNLKRLTR